MDWLETLGQRLHAGEGPLVRVVVARVRGSAPRDAGACMLVERDRQHGTIGGGHLEHVATATARGMLAGGPSAPRLDRFSLGASLGQCCGGIVELLFLRYDARDLAFVEEALARRASQPGSVLVSSRIATGHHLIEPSPSAGSLPRLDEDAFRERLADDRTGLWIFGAGHVGRALVGMLAELPFAITWVDSREAIFPTEVGEAPRSPLRVLHSPHPEEEAAVLPVDAWALVMTHSHDEDYAICEALLRHGGCAWIGLIGSGPKAARFRQRLAHRGFGERDIARIASPIGIGAIASKEPAAIAVSVAAQLLQLREAARSSDAARTRTA